MLDAAAVNDSPESPSISAGGLLVGAIIYPIAMMAGLLVYAAPTAIAYVRGHQNVMPILVLNLFFGWTMVGWVACLAWAFTSDVNETRQFIREVVVHEGSGAA